MSLCVAHGCCRIASKAGFGAGDGKAGSAGGRRHKASGRTRLARAPAGSATNGGEDGAALWRPSGKRWEAYRRVVRGPRIRKGPPRRERPLSILHRNVWENTLDRSSPRQRRCHLSWWGSLEPVRNFQPSSTFAAAAGLFLRQVLPAISAAMPVRSLCPGSGFPGI
jgi:hypothetical protein